MTTNCQPLDNQASTNCPHRLDKISIDKNRLDENIEEKERTTPKNKKNVKDNKNNNAEAVTLTEKEYDKLMSEHSKPFVDKCIEILNNYKLSKGVKYKSDYHAIRSWVIGEVQKRYPQLASQPSEQQDKGNSPNITLRAETPRKVLLRLGILRNSLTRTPASF